MEEPSTGGGAATTTKPGAGGRLLGRGEGAAPEEGKPTPAAWPRRLPPAAWPGRP